MKHLDRHTFDENLGQQAVVDFYTSECPSCVKFSPVFERAENLHSDYTFIKVNLDDDITLAERYGLTHVPTIMKFVGGVPVKSRTGFMSDEEFGEFIEGESK